MTKLCNKCNQVKSVDEFYKRKDKYQPWCKNCKKINDASYRKKNMDYFVAKAKEQKQELRNWYNELKSGPCADCGQFFDPVVMDFDHLPEFQKEHEIAHLLTRGSKTKILAEIEKCDLVCANCHRLRTKNRKTQS